MNVQGMASLYHTWKGQFMQGRAVVRPTTNWLELDAQPSPIYTVDIIILLNSKEAGSDCGD